METKTYDAVVIGGSAAGLSAAQTLGRSLRRTLVIDSAQPRNRFAAGMHNVLGHDGRSPAELIDQGRAEATRYGVEFRSGSVAQVMSEAGRLRVELAGGEGFTARALVVSTGVTDVLPEIEGMAEQWGKGVLHCPYCHGWEVRGKRLAVVTTSPRGMHQAKLVRQLSEHLTVFSHGLGEVEARTEKALTSRGVRIVPDPVTAILADGDRVSAVRTSTGERYEVDAVFTMSRTVPNDAFLRGLGLERVDTPEGRLLLVDAMGRTSHPRIWAAGNVVDGGAKVPQAMAAGTVAGTAVNAALVDEDFRL